MASRRLRRAERRDGRESMKQKGKKEPLGDLRYLEFTLGLAASLTHVPSHPSLCTREPSNRRARPLVGAHGYSAYGPAQSHPPPQTLNPVPPNGRPHLPSRLLRFNTSTEMLAATEIDALSLGVRMALCNSHSCSLTLSPRSKRCPVESLEHL